jgi:serine/threonine-protein kinase
MGDRQDRWHRLEAAFHDAAALPPAARGGYLDRACSGDSTLRSEIEALLAADAPERALGIEHRVCDADSTGAPDPFVGMRLGPWRIVEPLGSGGMGTVYLADRADGQYEQQIALKVVRPVPGAGSRGPRLQAERHMLARLSHPNIARLLDAGWTPEGSAWLAMEFVDGIPITGYCDDRRLTVDERLRLFAVVARATQHAHQSLIVHRDLKPANILVSRDGTVKLLDFGIAKLLDPVDADADPTARELRVLTPGYAAPEQIRGEPVTTAADVFVLGVVLYELLTGHRPARPAAAADLNPPAAVAPSQAIRLGATHPDQRTSLEHVAAMRRTTIAKLARRLDGDIDRVVMMALREEPDRRYGSAAQLADEIDRLLDGRPVLAQPDSVAYRVRRFVGRHRVGVGLATALFALTFAFAVVAGMQAQTIAAERDRAQVEAARASRLAGLTADLFTLAEPAAGRGESITARELLDQAGARVETGLAGDSGTQATLLGALGAVYASLGLHDEAIGRFTRSLELRRRDGSQNPLAEADTLHRLGVQQMTRGDHAAAEARLGEALAIRRTRQAPDTDIAATLLELARVVALNSQFERALPALEEVLRFHEAQPGPPTAAYVSTLTQFGNALHRTGDLKRAKEVFDRAAESAMRVSGSSPDHVTTLAHLADLVRGFESDPARAEPLYREALARARRIYPSDHQVVGRSLRSLARGLVDLERYGEAEPLARESVDMLRRLYGDRHNETMMSVRILAAVLRRTGRVGEAERLFRAALADARVVFGDGNVTTLATGREVASILVQQGRLDEARDVHREVLSWAIAASGENDVFVAIGLTLLGDVHLKMGQPDDALGCYRRALAIRRHLHPAGHWRIDEARIKPGEALIDAGRMAEARAELQDAHERLLAARGANDPATVAARQQLDRLREGW